MLQDLLDANGRYVDGFALAGLAAQAATGCALVTCMDTRIDPLGIFDLRPGDAKIVRNAGGRVTDDVLRSLILAGAYLGVTEIAVMHHTRCALAGRTDGDLAVGIPGGTAPEWEWLAMPDPDAALQADVERVRSCDLLPAGVRVEGWRYDVETGAVARVVPSTS